VRLGVDRGRSVKGIAEAVGGRGPGHELGDALGACSRDGVGVEVGLGHQLGGEDPGGDVPTHRRALYRAAEAGGDEGGKSGAGLTLAASGGRCAERIRGGRAGTRPRV
jgi:hypothetical protein